MDDGLYLNQNVIAGGEGEVAMLQHCGGKLVDKGQGLCMEVPKHGVQVPMSDESDGVGVDVAAQ